MNTLKSDGALDVSPESLIVTTYGSLKPGQAYRLPGSTHWYHRSKNARLTQEMAEREVETPAGASAA